MENEGLNEENFNILNKSRTTETNNKKLIQKPNKKSWSTKYKVISPNTQFNVKQNMVLDGVDSGLPINMPIFIVGSKNAGKSTLINTIITAASKADIFNTIIYISPDNVDTTLAETCHVPIIRIPNNIAEAILTMYLKIKSTFISWCKFLLKNNFTRSSIPEMLKNYSDQNIDAYIRSLGSISDNVSESILMHACQVIKKFTQPFTITYEDISYKFPKLSSTSRDMIVMDDLANNSMFPTNKSSCKLYGYITACRHYNLLPIFSGQDILQLPRYMRKEIDTWIFGNGVNVKDINTHNCNIPQNKINIIVDEISDLNKYEFIYYNGINNEIGYL